MKPPWNIRRMPRELDEKVPNSVFMIWSPSLFPSLLYRLSGDTSSFVQTGVYVLWCLPKGFVTLLFDRTHQSDRCWSFHSSSGVVSGLSLPLSAMICATPSRCFSKTCLLFRCCFPFFCAASRFFCGVASWFHFQLRFTSLFEKFACSYLYIFLIFRPGCLAPFSDGLTLKPVPF